MKILTDKEKRLIIKKINTRDLYNNTLVFIKEVAKIDKDGIMSSSLKDTDIKQTWLNIFEFHREKKFYPQCVEYCRMYKKVWETEYEESRF